MKPHILNRNERQFLEGSYFYGNLNRTVFTAKGDRVERSTQTHDMEMLRDVFENEFTYPNGLMRNVCRFARKPALPCPFRDRTWTCAELNRITSYGYRQKDSLSS